MRVPVESPSTLRIEAIRLATGIYAIGAALAPEDVVRHHRFELIAHFWPYAVICGRSALAGAAPVEGVIYIATPDGRQAPLVMPGTTFQPVLGPGPLPGDNELPAGVHMSGPARTLIENIASGPGRPPRHRAGLVPAEDRIDTYARSGGAGRIGSILDQLDVIAGSFDPTPVAAVFRGVLLEFHRRDRVRRRRGPPHRRRRRAVRRTTRGRTRCHRDISARGQPSGPGQGAHIR